MCKDPLSTQKENSARWRRYQPAPGTDRAGSPVVDEFKAEGSTIASRGDYEVAGAKLGALVDKKQAAYGDSFSKAGRILAELYPDGIRVAQYDDMLTVVRIIDKLFRVATDRDALGESPFKDIAGYGLLASVRVEKK